MLDFDGTISPIVHYPDDAYLPRENKRTLIRINKHCPVVIVTGRSLAVIRRKIRVNAFIHIASHGLEWNIDGRTIRKPVPPSVTRAIARIARGLRHLLPRYPKLIIERKSHAVVFHYHLLSSERTRIFRKDMARLLAPLRGNHEIKMFTDKKTVDIIPQLHWTKGDAALFVFRALQKKARKTLLPLYIGDSTTDEDVFRAFRGGITIRVGEKKGSAAQYFFRNRHEVDIFLARFASFVSSRAAHTTTATATSLPRIP